MDKEYKAGEIERRWQKFWEEIKLFKAPEKPKNKYYVLEMFPYPSGRDLHMGHLKNYAIGDAVARIKMMEGYEVLHPMGWDSFGLPAENAAIQWGIHPREWTYNNIEGFREQLKKLGLSYDWDREFATSDPEYYKWTQKLFLILYKRGLAYRKGAWVNWCPNCKTVLANEQVVEGKCERCKTPVEKKKLTQWFFKITEYADRLLKDLEKLRGHWPEHVIKQQENWIGKSEGTEIVFKVGDLPIRVFTTRADTVFGVTFISVAPDSEITDEILKFVSDDHRENVLRYINESLVKSPEERQKGKTGVFTGLYAEHPFTKEKIPVFVADYVLGEYGTGAVMGVPAHDQRDFEFAQTYKLPIKVVVFPEKNEGEGFEEFLKCMFEETDSERFSLEYKGKRYIFQPKRAYELKGILKDSGEFTGLKSDEAIKRIGQKLKEMGLGGPAVAYRIRDWLVSRQRYWGAPIPIIHCPRCGEVPDENLPVLLPHTENFLPKGRSPLEDVPEFINTKCPRCGADAKRDPDTMDTFVDSSWYFLRFTDPKNDKEIFDKERANAWMPVDQYIGGAEHATKHLIYARFITKVLYDEGILKYDEPFTNLFTQGLVLKKFWWSPVHLKSFPNPEDVEYRDGKPYLKADGTPLEERLEMMSKSRGNVVPLGPFVDEYGADAARVAILFAAPPDMDFEWTDATATAAIRFLNKIWRVFYGFYQSGVRAENEPDLNDRDFVITINEIVAGIRKDYEKFKFNTAIAKLMEAINAVENAKITEKTKGWFINVFVRLLAPVSPHLAEELFHKFDMDKLLGKETVFKTPLPEPLPGLIREEVEIGVQINGKFRGTLKIPINSDEEYVLEIVKNNERLSRYLTGEIKKVIYVPGKIVNIITGL
ncbi:MAG: leucine--tRNA ligase [candidate division WOR-3 bacterium]